MDTRGTSKPRAETGKPKQIPISGGYREHFSKRISLTTTERIDFEGVNVMNKTLVFWPVALLTSCTSAPYALRDMGSFHVGGRDVEITGKPVKEVVFTPGGVPAKVDLNGTYSVEAMYVQYFLPANRRGAVPLLMWHGGGLTGVSYETTPDGREGWMNFFVKQGWDVYNSDALPDAEALPRIRLREKYRIALENIRRHRPARTPALHRVRVVHVPALLHEEIHPALAPVGRRLVRHPRQAPAVPHQERHRPAAIRGQEVLHVHRLDRVGAVEIDLRRHPARREHHLLHRLPRDLHIAPADMERAHVAESVGGGGAGGEEGYRPKNKCLIHDVNPLKVNPFCRSQRYAFGEVLSISTRNWDLFRFARPSSRFRRPSRIHLVTRSRSVSDMRIPRITPVIDSFGI